MQNDTAEINNTTTEQTHTDKALTQCQHELEEWKSRALRISADFDNYQKRMEKEKTSWMYTAQAQVFSDLLTIVDDFDRAVGQWSKDHTAQQQITGLELIQKNIHKLLEKYGVKEITQMKIFDPELHEGLIHVDSPDHKTGEIVTVLQKGYLFKNNVLRPAKVSVAK